MNFVEYGKENKEVIILLHGGGLSWWSYREVAQLLETNYHVILPILDGHANADKDFTTIRDNAIEIVEYIENNFCGSVKMIGGLSLGAQILLEILSLKKDICQYAIIESALVLPSKLTYALIKPAFGSSYGLIKQKWFSKLQFKSLKIKNDLYEEYYRDTCLISKENMIAFLEENSVFSFKDTISDVCAKVFIYVGEKENQAMKKSAKLIHNKIPNSELYILPNLAHGEFSINHAKEYINEINKML